MEEKIMQKYISPELTVIEADKKVLLKDTTISVGNEPDLDLVEEPLE